MSRFCFKQDDNCHNYMIPVELVDSFNAELEKDWDDPDWEFDFLFAQYRCDSVQNWTFTDPKEDA